MTGMAALGTLVARVLEALGRALPLLAAWAAGRARVRAEEAERRAAIHERQVEAAMRRPRDRDELLERLRREGL
jgi:hypothetical protein